MSLIKKTDMANLSLSVEFFPPRDGEGIDRLIQNVVPKLATLTPDYFSVTYGAGGSTRDGTKETVRRIIEAGFNAAPHLSLGLDNDDTLRSLLDEYVDMGVQRIVALRGDQPSGFGANRFANNAERLVDVIRAHSGNQFELVVAAYPEVHPDAASAASDLDFFARKVDAGATRAITQYFYNADAYEEFMERCASRGLSLPIIPGIMPITSYDGLVRFSKGCGAEIPRWLDYKLAAHRDDDAAVTAIGDDVVTNLCSKLIALGAPGLHFYSLNRWGATTRICERLGLGNSSA